MTEKEFAQNICKVSAQNIVDQNGGISMGGITILERESPRLQPWEYVNEIRYFSIVSAIFLEFIRTFATKREKL